MPRPTFVGRYELARYIDPIERDGTHASWTAFLLTEQDLRSQEPHLSVNSLEVETLEAIADYYRQTIAAGQEDISVCTHKVQRYVECGRSSGAVIVSDPADSWIFTTAGGDRAPAFKHREVRVRGGSSSLSHCGVEFIRALSEVQQRQLARRLARTPRFHMVSPPA